MSGTRSPTQQICFAAHDADAKRRISTAVTCQTLLLVTQYHYLGGVLVGEWPFEQEIIIFSAVNDIAAITVMSSRSADHAVLARDSRSSSLAGNSRSRSFGALITSCRCEDDPPMGGPAPSSTCHRCHRLQDMPTMRGTIQPKHSTAGAISCREAA